MFLDLPETPLEKKKSFSSKVIGWENDRNPIIEFTILDVTFTCRFDAKTKILHIRESDIPERVKNTLLNLLESKKNIVVHKKSI